MELLLILMQLKWILNVLVCNISIYQKHNKLFVSYPSRWVWEIPIPRRDEDRFVISQKHFRWSWYWVEEKWSENVIHVATNMIYNSISSIICVTWMLSMIIIYCWKLFKLDIRMNAIWIITWTWTRKSIPFKPRNKLRVCPVFFPRSISFDSYYVKYTGFPSTKMRRGVFSELAT